MRVSTLVNLLAAYVAYSTARPLEDDINISTPSTPQTSIWGSHQSGGEEYVVIVDKDQTCGPTVLSRLALHPNHTDVKYTFENAGFRGFVATMQDHCLHALGNMSDILHVEKRVLASSRETVRKSAPWGLERISSNSYMFGNPKSVSYAYAYANSSLGQGVDIYILDTGIYTDNKIFAGRARMGWSFEADPTDHDGHGTHVSGTAAGGTFGVASGANLIGVKVLGDDGGGESSNTIAGIDYVLQAHEKRKASGDADFRGSIMSMSWGLDSESPSIQTAIKAALSQGIHVSVAAGNSGTDACNKSPSMAGGTNSAAVVVGSIDEMSAISDFSNTGPCVDIYAPGEDVLSAWIGAPNVVQYLSGTSMACPHVTGVMAYLMSGDDTLAASPDALKGRLMDMSLRDMVHGKAVVGDQFRLVNNGALGVVSGAVLASRGLRQRPSENAREPGQGEAGDWQLSDTEVSSPRY